MAYDAAHGQIVLFGGYGSNELGDTWVWDGSTWTQKNPPTSPSARDGHTMAYDATHGQVVLFGGWDGSNELADSWVWDGNTWTQGFGGPSRRDGQAVAYDAAHGQIVMFGGYDNGVYRGDTSAWNGTNWGLESPPNTPNPRAYHAMAYDAARGHVVLFGGVTFDGYFGDTWLWDGSTWTKTSSGPPARGYNAMAYDGTRGQVVLFGGFNSGGDFGDTWVWNGTTWIQESPSTSPSARDSHAMAYDAARGQVVLFGGLNSEPLNDTWVLTLPEDFDAANVCPSGSTPAPCSQTIAYPIVIPSGTSFGATPIQVVTQGAPNLDFALASTTCANLTGPASCTATVSFAPVAPGLRMGAVSLVDSTGHTTDTIFIHGIGVAAALAFTPGIISTVAGNGTSGFIDNTSATSAEFASPSGVAVDSVGNLYIADNDNCLVRKVTAATRSISTVAGVTAGAGTGANCGFSGDGGPATSAELATPSGVAVDGAGNLYIADSQNYRVRKVDASGNITTVAGTGTSGYNGDKIPATTAELGDPRGVAVDGAGVLYIADFTGQRIRKVDSSGIITTVAGDGTAGYIDNVAGPSGEITNPNTVALDSAGNLYIADSFNCLIREVTASTGMITTVAGTTSGAGSSANCGSSGDGGAATAAELGSPYSIAVDSAGDIYIADFNNQRIRKVDGTGTISTVAGSGTSGSGGDDGPATSAQFFAPGGVTVDAAGDLYVADTGNNRIREVNVGTSALSFGSVKVNDVSSAQSVVVSNIGNAALDFTSFAVSSNFGAPGPEGGDCLAGTPLLSGTGCNVEAFFRPGVPGPLTGTITVADNALNSPHLVNLSGLGVLNDFSISANPNSVTLQPGAPGGTSISTALISGSAETVALGVSGLPAGASASFSPTSVTAGGGSTLNLNAGTATPNTYSLTVTGTAASASHTTPVTLIISAPATVNVSVGTSPVGLAFTVDGATPIYTSTKNFTWTIGSPHTVATTSPQGTATRYTFTGWSDGGAISHPVTASATTTSYTASFSASYLLTTSSSPPAGGSVTPASGNYYAPSLVVPLTATAASGYVFTGWTGSVANPSSASTTVTMSAPQTVVANFASSLSIVPPGLAFGDVALGTSKSLPLTVRNVNSSSFKITNITFHYGPGAGKDFGYTTQCGGTLKPGQSCTITVTLKAEDLGSGAASLLIYYSLPGSPATVALTGNVISPPRAKLSKSSLSFGNVKVNQSATQTVVLTSTGTTPLTINSITVSGSNFTTSTCTSPLMQNASCTISVTFRPTAKKSYSGTLKISDNASPGPQTVDLSGKGN